MRIGRAPAPTLVPHYQRTRVRMITGAGVNRELATAIRDENREEVFIIDGDRITGYPERTGWAWWDPGQRKYGAEMFMGSTLAEMEDSRQFIFRKDVRNLALAIQRDFRLSRDDSFTRKEITI